MSETGKNIALLRALSRMTQDEIATVAHVSRSAVAQWERGFAEPRMSAIERLSGHFHIPKVWIIEKDGMSGVEMVAGVLLKPGQSGLTNEESLLLGLYRSMSTGGRRALLASAQGLVGAFPESIVASPDSKTQD